MVALTDSGAEADARARVAQAAATRAELERSRLDSEKAIASSQARWLDEELARKSELLLGERRAASALVGVPPAASSSGRAVLGACAQGRALLAVAGRAPCESRGSSSSATWLSTGRLQLHAGSRPPRTHLPAASLVTGSGCARRYRLQSQE